MNGSNEQPNWTKTIEPLLPAALSQSKRNEALKTITRLLAVFELRMQEAPPGQDRVIWEKLEDDGSGTYSRLIQFHKFIDDVESRRAFVSAAEKLLDAFYPEFFYDEGEFELARYEQAIETIREMIDVAEEDADALSTVKKWETRGGAMDPRFEALLRGLIRVWKDCGGSLGGHANRGTEGGPLIRFVRGACGLVRPLPTPNQVEHWVRKLRQRQEC